MLFLIRLGFICSSRFADPDLILDKGQPLLHQDDRLHHRVHLLIHLLHLKQGKILMTPQCYNSESRLMLSTALCDHSSKSHSHLLKLTVWKQPVIVIIRLMLSLLVYPKVITLSDFYCTGNVLVNNINTIEWF